MQMQVETFEQVEESVSGVPETERTEEAIALIEKLGLKGQEQMLSKSQDKTVVRNPYREMSREELVVYRTLFPEHTEVEKYDKGFIPLRVLQVAAHAKELEQFKSIQVWGERTAPTDPVLVGLTYPGDQTWNSRNYILARWGTALEPFSVLRERAKKAIISGLKIKAEGKKAECDKVLASLEACAESEITGDSSVYINI